MLLATIFALTAAVLHAGWNLIAKRSVDPFIALCTQFAVAGVISAVIVVATGGLPHEAWVWAAGTGLFHVPYLVGLGWAYRNGDFSLAYPIARGGGALVAAIGGLVLLDDDLKILSLMAIGIVVAGLLMLAVGAPGDQVVVALVVAVSIGGYTLVDSHAAREFSGTYVFAAFVVIGVFATAAGLASGRAGDVLTMSPDAWRRTVLAAALSIVTYGLVLLAVRRAAVGYVAALRESSVVIASVVGWRLLGERSGRTRSLAAGVILAGLMLLIAAR
jgi:drug/metabolite transporter (DMT)-like permease